MRKERIIFAGTPEFAVPALRALVADDYNVVAVLTQPDKPVGRKKIITAPPVKVVAESLNIPVLQPEKVNTKDSLKQIASYAPDLLITAAYGQIFRSELLNLPHRGCINLHASLLPAYRGAAPVQRSIMNGDAVTGISIMHMDVGCDTGDVYCQRELIIDPAETAEDLLSRLSEVASDLLLEFLPVFFDSGVEATEQASLGEATHAARITNDDCPILWQRSALDIHNQVRALSPQPGAFAFYQNKKIKILKTRVSGQQWTGNSGEIVDNRKHLVIKCGEGALIVDLLQPAGKQLQAASEVAHNYHLGTIFV